VTGTQSDAVTALDQLAAGDTFEMLPGATYPGVWLVAQLDGGLTNPATATVPCVRLSDGLALPHGSGVQVLRVPYRYDPAD